MKNYYYAPTQQEANEIIDRLNKKQAREKTFYNITIKYNTKKKIFAITQG